MTVCRPPPPQKIVIVSGHLRPAIWKYFLQYFVLFWEGGRPDTRGHQPPADVYGGLCAPYKHYFVRMAGIFRNRKYTVIYVIYKKAGHISRDENVEMGVHFYTSVAHVYVFVKQL